MSEKFNWKFTVDVVGGPTLAASGSELVDAYNKSKVIVPAKNGGTDGEITLTLDIANASILVIKASHYVDPDEEQKILQYAIDGGNSKDLTGPLFMLGENAVKLLGDTVADWTFTNPTSVAITIEAVIGHDATPE